MFVIMLTCRWLLSFGGTCCFHLQDRRVPSTKLWHHNPQANDLNFYFHKTQMFKFLPAADLVNKMHYYCIIKTGNFHSSCTRQNMKCSYHLQYQQPICFVLFLAVHSLCHLPWLFVVELFVISGSVALTVSPCWSITCTAVCEYRSPVMMEQYCGYVGTSHR
jgi:hypothetical protein